MMEKFSSYFSKILVNFLGPCVVVYVDDICCVGYTLKECADFIQKVLRKLNNNNIVINAEKCEVCTKGQFFEKNNGW